MRSLSGVDGTFLHLETPQTPMHVASLHLYELPPGYKRDFHKEMTRQVRNRLPQLPALTRKLAPMPLQFANPVWIDANPVDLAYHVQRVVLPRPGTQAQLEDCAARLHGELLDRDHPLWRIHVIDGLASGHAAYYFKVHHAVLDGQAGVLLALALCDLSAEPHRSARRAVPAAEHPGTASLVAAALRHDASQYIRLVRHLPDLVRTLAGLFTPAATPKRASVGSALAFGPKTPLNVPIDGERGFSAMAVPLATLKSLARAHDAKLNDIVMALCSGALRRYLAAHGGIPKKPLIAAMPISLRAAGNTEFTTQATMSLVNLQTQIADPVRRLRAIRDGAAAVKALAQRAKGVIPTDFPSIGAPWLLHGLAALYGRSGLTSVVPPIANVVISNVPGPTFPLYAAGARMVTYWPMSIVEHGLGLNLTVLSYDGTMCFGFTTARKAIPEAGGLTVALQAALDELVARSRAAPRRKTARAAPVAKPRPGAPVRSAA